MNLQISKWGNSLAIRIPAEYGRALGVKEGDQVQASMSPDGSFLVKAKTWNRKTFAQELAQARRNMPVSTPVIDELRRGGKF